MVTPPTAAEFAKRFDAVGSFLDATEMQALFDKLVPRDVAVGEVLVREGSAAGTLWFAWSAQLIVELEVNARVMEVGRAGPGSVVGEIAFLDRGVGSATVKVGESGTLLSLDRDALDELRSTHPRAATSVLRALCQSLAARVRTATDVLENLRHPNDAAPGERSFMDAFRALLGMSRTGAN